MRKQYEEARFSSKFPELSVVDSSEEALKYLVEKEQFEDAHPAKKARQARNEKAWKKPVTGRTPASSVEIDDGAGLDKKHEKVTKEPSSEAQKGGIEGTDAKVAVKAEFEGILNDSQLEILEEIRARREARRAAELKKR